jgi:hypothetical protein
MGLGVIILIKTNNMKNADKLTYRGCRNDTSIYYNNDIALCYEAKEGDYSGVKIGVYMVYTLNSPSNEYPKGWITYQEWRKKQIDTIGRIKIIEDLKDNIIKKGEHFEDIDSLIELIDEITYGV